MEVVRGLEGGDQSKKEERLDKQEKWEGEVVHILSNSHVNFLLGHWTLVDD